MFSLFQTLNIFPSLSSLMTFHRKSIDMSIVRYDRTSMFTSIAKFSYGTITLGEIWSRRIVSVYSVVSLQLWFSSLFNKKKVMPG